MPRVLTLNAGSNHAKSGGANLDASFRHNLSNGNSFANVRSDGGDGSNSGGSNEPKVYQFEPCLSVCCGRFDHARGAMAVAAAGVMAGAAAAAATLYLVLEREQYEDWLPSESKLVRVCLHYVTKPCDIGHMTVLATFIIMG